MGPQSDVDKIRDIYRAEREADRIVREAEDAAAILREEAEAAAGNVLAAKRAEIARRSGEERWWMTRGTFGVDENAQI